MKVTPIKYLLSDVKKLSKYPEANKKELDQIRDTIIKQKKVFDKIDLERLNNKLNSDNLSYEKYASYKDIYNEKKAYIKNKAMINDVINRDYDKIKIKREYKQKKMRGRIIVVALAISLFGTTIGLLKNKNKNNNKDNYKVISTEASTEIITTEKKTEVPSTEKKTEVPSTEKKTEAPSTEKKTEAPTTEKKTEAPTTEKKTEAPSTEKKTEAPSTEKKTEAPSTEKVTEAPTTEKITEAPSSEKGKKEETTEIDIREYVISDDIDPELVNNFANTVLKFDQKMDVIEQAIIDPEKRTEAKKVIKEKFITLVDFIFYDGEIDGIHFNDLTDKMKEKVYSLLQKADKTIIKYDPDYKESIGEKYNKVKDFAETKLNQAIDYFKDKIGEENYDKIIETKDKIIDGAKDAGKKIKKYTNDTYQNFKNKEDTEE